MKRHFGVGIIKKRSDGLHSYDVTNPRALQEMIVPFFKKYNFLSQTKKKNFSLFQKAVKLMFEKRHLTAAGLAELLEIREKLNQGAGRTRKYSKDIVLLESSETTR